jgi:type IV secretory pathway TrbL component
MSKMLPLIVALLSSGSAFAASGEMGTGVPNMGFYTQATGANLTYIFLKNAAVPLPSGCGFLILSVATAGERDYKIAQAMLLASSFAGKRIRFYAHAERDGGCGVDYLQNID